MNNNVAQKVNDLVLASMPPRFKNLKPNDTLYNKVISGDSLLITGSVGTGKTRMMLEIIYSYMLDTFRTLDVINSNEVLYDKDPKHYVKKLHETFLNSTDVLDRIRSSYNGSKNSILTQELINKPVLFLDDLGTEVVSDWVKEQFYLIINDRYNWVKPLVITTNLTMKEIAENYGERFASRLVEMCEIIKLVGEDRRTEK